MNIKIKNIIYPLLTIQLLSPQLLSSKILTISPSGQYKSLSAAIKSAQNGDHIIIEKGTYKEFDIVIDKKITIEGRNNPVLDAIIVNKDFPSSFSKSIMIIKKDSVSISGITFKNTPVSFIKEYSAILLDSVRNCSVYKNKFYNNFFAIYNSHSLNCYIANNLIIGRSSGTETNSGNGIHLWYSKNINIISNEISHHRDGLYLEFVEDAHILNNISRNNLRYGLHFMFSHRCKYESNQFISNSGGVAVMYTKNVEMLKNKFLQNWGKASYGLLIKDITDSRIEKNIFKSNSIGMQIENSSRNKVNYNDLLDNGWAVKINTNSMDNTFSLNNFIGNTFDISTHGKQNHNIFKENYWSEYSGYDLNKDGYGDVPYRPVKLFSMIIQQNSSALILLKSIFIYLLDIVEQIIPALTPESLIDARPLMKSKKNVANTTSYNNSATVCEKQHNIMLISSYAITKKKGFNRI
jgi:nitrous oxidase accessory protein